MTDHKDLKIWCHQKRKEKDIDEDDLLFVKAIEDAISQAGMVPPLRAQLAEAQKDCEQLRMQLAGCGVATMSNTEKTAKERLGKDNPYWSASYGDVCAAVDREMSMRAKLDCSREALEQACRDECSVNGQLSIEHSGVLALRKALAKLKVDSSPRTVNHDPDIGCDVHKDFKPHCEDCIGPKHVPDTPAIPRIDELCRCGHTKIQHIYAEGACRPGFVCEARCKEYFPVTK